MSVSLDPTLAMIVEAVNHLPLAAGWGQLRPDQMTTFYNAQIAQMKDEHARLVGAISKAEYYLVWGASTLREQREAAAALLSATQALVDFLARDQRPDTSPAWDLVGEEGHPSPIA